MTRRTKQTPNLAAYAGKWVALSSNQVVAVGSSLPEVMRKLPARRLRLQPSVFLVPRRDERPYILGRDNFFRQFLVTFDERGRTVRLQPYRP